MSVPTLPLISLLNQNNCGKKAPYSPNLNGRTPQTVQAEINTLTNQPGEVDPLAFYASLALVHEIDFHLERGEHYRIAGRFCKTLDEAVNALRAVP